MLARTNRRAPKPRNIRRCLTVVFLLCAPAAFASKHQEPNAVQAREYNAAIAQKQTSDRIRELELFTLTASGPLKTDALEVVVWEYLRAGNNSRALTWANELNVADKENALAIAVICNGAKRSPQQGVKPDQLRRMAIQGLNALPRLRHPAGMSDADFAALRHQASLLLGRVAGQPGPQQRVESNTKTASHHTAPVETTNARSMYQSAMVDLGGKNPNPRQGYWELARAVVLSGGSIDGHPIGEQARRRYLKEGGTNAGWDQFLEAAAAGNPDLAPRARFATASSTSAPSRTVAASTAQPGRRPQTAAIKTVTASSKPSRSGKPQQDKGELVWADSRTANAGIIHKPRVTTGPMSLGILIETSLTSEGRHGALGNTLVDMLRHIGDDDEAFILSYDNHLVFEEDLTNDPEQLDQAMQDIRPGSGAKLDEAVAFAAGHLARIAKNPNRILLVISDGRNVDSQTSPVQTSGLINAAGVRIYCIGIGVDKFDGRSHLRALSAGTGGQSDFISNSSQFRGATRQIAQNIGIDFRF